MKRFSANPYEIMVSDGRVHDIEDLDYDRWCEYIFYRGLYRTSFLRMSRGSITDTEMQVGQFVVPKFGHHVVGEWGNEDEQRDAVENADAKEKRYLRINKEALPSEHVSLMNAQRLPSLSSLLSCHSGSQWITMGMNIKAARMDITTMYSAHLCITIFRMVQSSKGVLSSLLYELWTACVCLLFCFSVSALLPPLIHLFDSITVCRYTYIRVSEFLSISPW